MSGYSAPVSLKGSLSFLEPETRNLAYEVKMEKVSPFCLCLLTVIS